MEHDDPNKNVLVSFVGDVEDAVIVSPPSRGARESAQEEPTGVPRRLVIWLAQLKVSTFRIRSEVDEAAIERYRDIPWRERPVVKVWQRRCGTGWEFIIVDGELIAEAARRNGEQEIPVEIMAFGNPRDALYARVKLNSQHGVPLSQQDRVRIAQHLRGMDFTQAEIAVALSVSQPTVSRLLSPDVENAQGEDGPETEIHVNNDEPDQNLVAETIPAKVALIKKLRQMARDTKKDLNPTWADTLLGRLQELIAEVQALATPHPDQGAMTLVTVHGPTVGDNPQAAA
jgi:predicted transcriptional regulator